MMTHCPITGVCLKRFWLCVLVGFGFIFAYEYFVNAVLLMDMYTQTAHLWRPEADMYNFYPFMLLMQFLTALITAFIFTRAYEGKGVGEGVRYGILIGLLLGVQMAAAYTWMPISSMLAVSWFVSGLFEGIGLGVIYALLYRK